MTINQEVVEGGWNQVKGKLHDRWGQISEDELEQARGNMEQLVGLIQQKTGEAREEIESYIHQAAENGASAVTRVAGAARSGAEQVAQVAQQATHSTAEAARAGYSQTENTIRQRPMESLAVLFGAGLIAGVVVGLLLRSK